LDNDGFVCDNGELCEFYPSNSEISGIVITKKDIKLGVFRMGFPVPVPKSASESSSTVLNAMDVSKSVNSVIQGPGKIVGIRPRE